jgi:hypothetical protein
MLYVSLGRNVHGVPMSDNDWEWFRHHVVHRIMSGEWVAEPDTVAYGKSNWVGESEETCVLVWFDKRSRLGGDTVRELEGVAKLYGQEAIAWSVAVTDFVVGVDRSVLQGV